MNEEILTYAIGAFIVGTAMLIYLRAQKRKDRLAREAAERGKIYTSGPRAQHPHIDTSQCIGCQSCTMVCPEGDVLGMLGGKAVFINPHKCIGHSLCADACPVGAITMRTADPSMSADLPRLTPECETTVPGLFIAGELGGLALIKNAVNQGRNCVDIIHARLKGQPNVAAAIFDVVIVGAGPGGISAALRSIELGLNYLLIEQEEIGGTVAKYPRQKLVMTSPVDLPIYGKFKKTQVSKESLLALWQKVSERADLRAECGTRVTDIHQGPGGSFTIHTQSGKGAGSVAAQTVILALGRTGTPRKLGVPGEQLGKVMYRLIEADHYTHKRILIVGGGDSAVEAAMGLANQVGNRVTLSYRQAAFSRLKDRNEKRIQEFIKIQKLEVLFNSKPVEVKEASVVIEVEGAVRELENDYVWVFAGGTPPNEFLKKIGVAFGAQDVTAEAHQEAYRASLPASA